MAHSRRFCEPRASRGALVAFYSEFAPRTPEGSGSPNPNREDKRCGRRAGATPRAGVGGQGGPASVGPTPDRVTVRPSRGDGDGVAGGGCARAVPRGRGRAGAGPRGGSRRSHTARCAASASGSWDFTPLQLLSGSSCPHGIWQPSWGGS